MTKRSIFFAATHRSGSTLLLETIRKLDLLGRPGEFFYPRNIRDIQMRLGQSQDLAMANWLPAVLTEGSSPNGFFSAKVFADNFHWLAEQVSGSPWPDGRSALAGFFTTHFPGARFLSIRRRDKLRQGISLLKAMQSGLWHSTQKCKVLVREPYYHRQRIQWAISNIEQQEEELDSVFESLGIIPKTCFYEDIIDDLPGILSDIFDFAGVVLPVKELPRINLARLGNLQTDSWVKRYQREQADAEGAGQAMLPDSDSPVFQIDFEQPSSFQVPGIQLESKYRIRNLRKETIRFIGHKGGRGSIYLTLHLTGPGGQRLEPELLPVPYKLEPNEEVTLDFHCALPRKGGTYAMEIRAKQMSSTELCISGSPTAHLTISTQLDKPVRKLFGDFEFTDDNWYYSPWFGFFYVNAWPWILSLSHGWLRINDTSGQSGLCLMDSELGDISCSRDSYPVITTKESARLKYYKTENEFRIFLDSGSREVQVPLSQRIERE